MDPELHIYTEQNNYLTNVEFVAPTALSFQGLFDNEINHFVDCVITRETPRAVGEDGVAMAKIIDAIYESARTGHEVVIK